MTDKTPEIPAAVTKAVADLAAAHQAVDAALEARENVIYALSQSGMNAGEISRVFAAALDRIPGMTAKQHDRNGVSVTTVRKNIVTAARVAAVRRSTTAPE